MRSPTAPSVRRRPDRRPFRQIPHRRDHAASLAAVLVALCGIALVAAATGARAAGDRRRRRLGDPGLDGLSRRCDTRRPPATDPRPLRLGLHSRPAVRPGRRRRARRSVRLAQCLFRARRHVRAGGGRSHLRTDRRSADPRIRPKRPTARGFVADYAAVLSNPFARIIITIAFIEAALAWGAFAYIGANLHLRFGLSFTLVGLTVACFGVGGLIYAGWCGTLSTGSARPVSSSSAELDHRRRLCRARNRSGLVAGAGRGHGDRARLLHVPQHAANQSDADDAARRAAPPSRSSPRRSISDRRPASPSARS